MLAWGSVRGQAVVCDVGVRFQESGTSTSHPPKRTLSRDLRVGLHLMFCTGTGDFQLEHVYSDQRAMRPGDRREGWRNVLGREDSWKGCDAAEGKKAKDRVRAAEVRLGPSQQYDSSVDVLIWARFWAS